MPKEAQPLFATESCCIYKVPHEIRRLNKDAYTPMVISIGPLHHGNSRLQFMWKIYTLAFASRLNNGGAHFTDLLRYFYLPPSHTKPSRNPNLQLAVLGHSACELVEAGVKFTVNKSSHSMLDLEFERGIFKIPNIVVGDETEIWLRNIVALELCHYPQEHYIIDYVNFFKQLVNSNKDADVLIKAGIIRTAVSGYGTSADKLFSYVCKNIVMLDLDFEHGILKIRHIVVDDFTV
ncbi:hypothetical protein PIB30_069282 [Stylosanthes scabra]|uniref:Uncharacterized protein n=1 Tax=Stylosanthes scabra TaxID=79078 RepID=A0ABU6XKY4_9FABA|nr:hypothetical protein [Stylosanthes scabra]